MLIRSNEYSVVSGSGIVSLTWSPPVVGYLAKAKEVFPYVDQLDEPTSCSFEGTLDEFLNKYNDPDLTKRAKNKIRKCPHCNKPVAFTLPTCNGCGTDITQVPISYSNNIFIGFIYGIQKGPFPFTISIRKQTPQYIVFDDLLSLCPCHLNVIPTTQYLPDWRYLLCHPSEALGIVNELFDNSWEVVVKQFLANKSWRNKIINGQLKDEDMRGHIASGFNYPPSQYQLHLQFMLPPFVPFHYNQYLNGTHFTKYRFFPYEYIIQLLKLNIPYNVQETTRVEEIITFYDKHNVFYDKIFAQCYARYGASHLLLSNWNKNDFEGFVVGNKYYKWADTTTTTTGTLERTTGEGDTVSCTTGGDAGSVKERVVAVEGVELEVKLLSEKDKLVLQNYGRPYKGGKPCGSYYKFAKQVENHHIKIAKM